MCGAFSDKWLDVSKRCGKEAEALSVDWGSHIDPSALDKKLATGEFDLVTLFITKPLWDDESTGRDYDSTFQIS